MIYKKAIICKTKNLFNKYAESQKGYYTESGSFVPYPAYNCFTIDVTESTEYCRSTSRQGAVKGIITFWNNDTFVSSVNKSEVTKVTFITPSGVNKLKIVVEAKYLDSYIQLEEGSTATPYQPYGYLQSYKKAIKVSDICQLVNSKLFTPMNNDDYALAGVSITKNIEAGTITFNGTSTNNFWYHVHDFGSELKYTNLIKGYKYYISGMPVNDLGVVFQLTSLFNLQGEQIFTAPKTSDGTGAFNIYVPKGVTLTDFVVTPQLFNLTETYKAGNEPTTVEEFRQKFPNDLYPYKPYCFVDSYKKYLKIKENNNA